MNHESSLSAMPASLKPAKSDFDDLLNHMRQQQQQQQQQPKATTDPKVQTAILKAGITAIYLASGVTYEVDEDGDVLMRDA